MCRSRSSNNNGERDFRHKFRNFITNIIFLGLQIQHSSSVKFNFASRPIWGCNRGNCSWINYWSDSYRRTTASLTSLCSPKKWKSGWQRFQSALSSQKRYNKWYGL